MIDHISCIREMVEDTAVDLSDLRMAACIDSMIACTGSHITSSPDPGSCIQSIQQASRDLGDKEFTSFKATAATSLPSFLVSFFHPPARQRTVFGIRKVWRIGILVDGS